MNVDRLSVRLGRGYVCQQQDEFCLTDSCLLILLSIQFSNLDLAQNRA